MTASTGRTYRMQRRADRQAETRQRIVEAAIALHQSIGPNATTMSDVAKRAGVGRVTVYRHFPDEPALARACSGHYFATHPFPDPAEWSDEPDPRQRLKKALHATYAYHRATEAMISHVLADARDHPVMRPYHDYWSRAADSLAEAFHADGRTSRRTQAAILVALSFDTWRTLVRQAGLEDSEAVVAVAMRLACECEEG